MIQQDNNNADYNRITEEEQRRLLRLGNLVLIDYVRSMVDLLRQNLEEACTQVTDLRGKFAQLKSTKTA